ncbi:MAG: hypothetical protein A2539_04995 [Elusimicrobia bacterium RIFOXYD2_FULL_34_15]|nr:MAG: hypothetical protein A2539_04995 [Elusimicrobia bacterium RIFOXYD2_FULL_34_15]
MLKRIAIFGATGHIAKSLIYNFSRKKGFALFLFARNLSKLKIFLKSIKCENCFKTDTFDKFKCDSYDVIINCVGVGYPAKVKELGSGIFSLTESYDNMVIEYLYNHSKSLYINFSSGAVFGSVYKIPVDKSTTSKWNINEIREGDYYGIAKLNSEAKHRSLKNLNIVDLRVFNYFSRFIEQCSGYLLTDIISCIRNKKKFITSNENITRDFVHPKDLFELIRKCISKKNINDAFDVYSKKVITKFEILEYFKKNYDLEYTFKKNISISSITGNKNKYYSEDRKAEKIGYFPKFSSLESIIQGSKQLLNKSREF